jgi:hypothetical protein
MPRCGGRMNDSNAVRIRTIASLPSSTSFDVVRLREPFREARYCVFLLALLTVVAQVSSGAEVKASPSFVWLYKTDGPLTKSTAFHGRVFMCRKVFNINRTMCRVLLADMVIFIDGWRATSGRAPRAFDLRTR